MIATSELQGWLKTYPITVIEQTLVQEYCTCFSIDWQRSPILSTFFATNAVSTTLRKQIESYHIDSLKSLESTLELIIPTQDRKLNGAFFTPSYIVEAILRRLEPQADETILDPSCGSGAFLLGATEYFVVQYGRTIRNAVRENIFGVDILPYNIERTKILLALYALQHGEILENEDFNLYCADSLEISWKQAFPNVSEGQFDVIIGNPPYVKFQDLSNERRNTLISDWSSIDNGTFNLYFAFFELGYNLLSSQGRLGYITPNNYFTSLAGESLRDFFERRRCVYEILDFAHNKVFDAQTYTSLTFLSKQPSESIAFDRIGEHQTPQEFVIAPQTSQNSYASLHTKKWRLLRADEREIITALESANMRLSEALDIKVGIATLKDELFFLDAKQRQGEYYTKIWNGQQYRIESTITKAVVKISDFTTQAECNANTRRIITPYSIQNGIATIIAEDRVEKEYPYCYEYLCAIREELVKRDKGKMKGAWYGFGRTQGIAKQGRKLITPTFSKEPRFLCIDDEEAYFCNGYGLFVRQIRHDNLFAEISLLGREENLDVMQIILNSRLMHYYITRTSVSIEGGYYCYQKNFIEKFTIPNLSAEQIKQLRALEGSTVADEYLCDIYGISISHITKPFLVNAE